MPIQAEQEVIEKAKAGDQQAFRVLVETMQGFVYSIAFRFVREKQEAEDLVQECFIRFWKNLSRYNPDYSLKSWLGKIITNLCLDFLKSGNHKNALNQISLDEKMITKDPSHFEDKINAEELHRVLLTIAEGLTPKQRAAFILRDLEMLEVAEVCQILDMTAGNLKSNLYYARLNIKQGLKNTIN